MSGRQRNIRAKRADSDDELDPSSSAPPEEEPQTLKERLELTKMIQKQRKKLGGTCADKLLIGPAADAIEPVLIQKEDAESASMARLMNSYVKATSTRESDEDPQMCVAWVSRIWHCMGDKLIIVSGSTSAVSAHVCHSLTRVPHAIVNRKQFVEMELAKRLGKRNNEEQLDEGEQRRRKIDEDLYSIPEHLQVRGYI